MPEKTIIKAQARIKKKKRIHKKIKGTSAKPRLVVFRSACHIYAQLVDDSSENTLTGVSTLTTELQADIKKAKNKTEKAKIVGSHIAQKAKDLKISEVVFDRGGYLYHGRVKAVADGAREGGLNF